MSDSVQDRLRLARACRARLVGKALAVWSLYKFLDMAGPVPSTETWLPYLVRAVRPFLSFDSSASPPIAVSAELSWAWPWCRGLATWQSQFPSPRCWSTLVHYRDAPDSFPISFLVLEHL